MIDKNPEENDFIGMMIVRIKTPVRLENEKIEEFHSVPCYARRKLPPYSIVRTHPPKVIVNKNILLLRKKIKNRLTVF